MPSCVAFLDGPRGGSHAVLWLRLGLWWFREHGRLCIREEETEAHVTPALSIGIWAEPEPFSRQPAAGESSRAGTGFSRPGTKGMAMAGERSAQ